MDITGMKPDLFVTTFVQLMTNTIDHYQYLGLMLVVASSYVSIKSKRISVFVLSIISGFISIGYLIFGLFIFRQINVELLNAGINLYKFNQSSINQLLVFQSWIGLAALVALLFAFILFIHNKTKEKR